MKVWKCVWSALGLLALHSLALCQPDALPRQGELAFERVRIAQQRREATADFKEQERACESKFAVTSCVHEVGMRRIDTLSELKRQEAHLNDADRLRRGAEQLKRSEEKASERAKSDTELSGSRDATRTEREIAHEGKIVRNPVLGRQSVDVGLVGRDIEKPVASGTQNNRAAYLQRLEDVQLRRANRDQRLRDRAKGAAALPTPP